MQERTPSAIAAFPYLKWRALPRDDTGKISLLLGDDARSLMRAVVRDMQNPPTPHDYSDTSFVIRSRTVASMRRMAEVHGSEESAFIMGRAVLELLNQYFEQDSGRAEWTVRCIGCFSAGSGPEPLHQALLYAQVPDDIEAAVALPLACSASACNGIYEETPSLGCIFMDFRAQKVTWSIRKPMIDTVTKACLENGYTLHKLRINFNESPMEFEARILDEALDPENRGKVFWALAKDLPETFKVIPARALFYVKVAAIWSPLTD